MKGIKMPTGIARLLASDPLERLLYDLEAAREEHANYRGILRVARRQEARTGAGWLHATDALLPCDRLLAGALLGVPPPRSPISPQTRRIFDNGTFMHLRWYWYFAALPKPYKVEVAKVLRRWPLVGEADVRLRHPELGKLVVELKSMNCAQFRNLTAPDPHHVAQALTYVGLSGDGWRALIWYENKNTQEVKMFQGGADRLAWADTWRRASNIAYGCLAGELPRPCRECPDREFCEEMIRLTPAGLGVLDEQRRAAETSRNHSKRQG